MNNEIFRVEIKGNTESIKLANAIKKVPIIKGEKKIFPKKYQNENYIWNAKNQLIHARTGDLVARNSIKAGTERWWRINGQDVYNQKVQHSARGGIMTKLHALFEPHLKRLKPVNVYPIGVKIVFHTPDYTKMEGRDKNIDNDNKWIYSKAIMDCLRDLKVIKDDSPEYSVENILRTVLHPEMKSMNESRMYIIGYIPEEEEWIN